MYVPSSELGPSIPSPPKRVCPSPRNQRGEAYSPAGEGVGESQFRWLEKKLSTLSTLWFGYISYLFANHISFLCFFAKFQQGFPVKIIFISNYVINLVMLNYMFCILCRRYVQQAQSCEQSWPWLGSSWTTWRRPPGPSTARRGSSSHCPWLSCPLLMTHSIMDSSEFFTSPSKIFFECSVWNIHRVPTPPPLRVTKAGRNHLNEEITPLLHTGIGEHSRTTKPYQI